LDGETQFSLEDMGALALADKLRAVDVDTLTPIEAMNLIYQWKKEL
jgi:DNA mismatch repair protein MutS